MLLPAYIYGLLYKMKEYVQLFYVVPEAKHFII